MKYIITILLFITPSLVLAEGQFGPFKFHYGDKVKIGPNACGKEEFVNVCGKVGIVTTWNKISDLGIWYDVKFDFSPLSPITRIYHEQHLNRVK